jgi:hypothetical protein
MDTTTVPSGPVPNEPSVWADIAAELRKIADDCLDLIGQPAPGCFDIDIHPLRISHPPVLKERAATIEGIDTVAFVLLGKKAETREMSGGSFHHTAKGRRGPITFSIYNAVADPAAVDPDEEIARLRAENEKLRAELGVEDPTGLTYGRDPEADPQPAAGRVPPHFEHGRGAPFDEPVGPIVQLEASGLTKAADRSRGPLAGTTPVVTYFSFGHGQTDPGTGKNLLDHYVTVVAPTYDGCREAMFASRFGRAWSFDYLAGSARATEWIPQWTEHEVIVAPGTDVGLADHALAAAELVLRGGSDL